MTDLPALIQSWRTWRQAQQMPDLQPYRDLYERLERDYRTIIRRRLGR